VGQQRDDVKKHDIERCVSTWAKRPRAGASSTRHILTLAKHLFNWAIAEDYISHTPFLSAQGTSKIHISGPKARTRRLEAGEAEAILAVGHPFISDFFSAMLETACRPGELRRLQWSEVHDDYLEVRADKAKTKRGRQVPITPTLDKILERRRKGPDGQNLSEDSFVFGDEVGHEVHRRRLHEWWADTCAAAKVTGLHLHDLRAESGSTLLGAGVPVHVVRDALGHSSLSMTNTYLRGRSSALADAYKRRHAAQARKRMKLAHVSQGAKTGTST
jgi:integrase